MKGTLSQKFESGKKLLGTFSHIGSELGMECLGVTGLDFAIVDNEHACFETETTCKLVRSGDVHDFPVIARVREISRPAIMKLLDTGASGLLIPNVESLEDAKKVVQYGKFPPIGKRGFSGTRMGTWGNVYPSDQPMETCMDVYNRWAMLFLQCETASCLEQIEEIAALEGVDGIFIGPYDLSISLGIPGQFDAPIFQAAVQRVLAACKAAGKYSIMYCGTQKDVIRYFRMGFDAVTYCLDTGILINAYKNELTTMKEALSHVDELA